jgi:hypothetical protein
MVAYTTARLEAITLFVRLLPFLLSSSERKWPTMVSGRHASARLQAAG